MITGLDHAALAVEDMTAALAFYCDVIGFQVTMDVELPPGIQAMNDAFAIEDASYRVCMIELGNTRIELFEFNQSEAADVQRPVNKIGITHIALASNDVEADFNLLSNNGVVFNAPLFGAAPGRFTYGRDPFGNVIELLEKPEGN